MSVQLKGKGLDRKWRVCACRKMNGNILLVLQHVNRYSDGDTPDAMKPRTKKLRSADEVKWPSWDGQWEFFQINNWWYLACTELQVRFRIICCERTRDLNDLPLRNPYTTTRNKSEGTLAKLAGEVKRDWIRSMIPTRRQLYDRSQEWSPQLLKGHKVQTNTEVRFAIYINSIIDQRNDEEANGHSAGKSEKKADTKMVEYVNASGVESSSAGSSSQMTRNEKRSSDQNEFISEELAQKKTKASLSESSGSGHSGSSASVQTESLQNESDESDQNASGCSNPDEDKKQGEILIEIEPDVQCDCMTVTYNSEWGIYITIKGWASIGNCSKVRNDSGWDFK